MPFGKVYVFGAAFGNTTDNSSWDVVKVYASADLRGFENSKLECCLKFHNGNSTVYMVGEERSRRTAARSSRLLAVHVTCNNKRIKNQIMAIGVAIKPPTLTCHFKDVKYVTPIFPMKEEPTKLALTAQVAFKSINAELIIEWIETYKFLGVDKIFTYYVDNLNKMALRALQYYSETGFLELYHYEPAQSDLYPRNLASKNLQTFHDLRIPMYDAFEKMSGYTYFGIIDFDEFLIPSKNRSLKQMLSDLFQQYSDAAGFMFMSQMWSLTWKPTGNVSDLILARYVRHVAKPPFKDRQKNIVKPKFIKDGRILTHRPTPRPGMKIVKTPIEDAFLRHYRACRGGREVQGCEQDNNRITDTSVAAWSSFIRDNVNKARKRVFGRDNIL